MNEIILLFGIGCSILSVVSGLTLSSNSRFIKSDAFNLVCDVKGTITTSIQFSDPSGTLVGFCSPPPLSCSASSGNTLQRDINKGTVSISIPKQNIQIPASEGNWSCTDGITADFFSVKIYSYTKPVIQSEVEVPVDGSLITVLIECIYPYPDEVKISYVKKSHPYPVLKSRSDVKFGNGTSTNCPVPDTRAISMNGTFLLSTNNLNGEEARIAVTALLNGFELSNPEYSNFTIQSVKGCKYSDAELFLGGFSCFLIVFGITSIIMLIFLLCQMLPKIFDDKKTNKIIIIVVFNSLALIFGFALGFGLKECEKRDLGLGLGLGFGFILAIALFLTLYIYHKQCGSKKENEDENRFSLDSCFRKCQVKPEKEIESPPKFNSKKPEDSPKRVGNKTDVLKGDQSALNQKVLHSPLPLPPVDNSQPSKASDDKLSRKKLDPIAVENEEANSSEKKKKKKKRKKKKIDNETADNNVEEAGDNGNLN